MSISSASVYGVPQTTSWRDISGQISSLADIFRRERQRNEELFLQEAYRQITTAYNGDAFAWAQNEPESYKKFAKLLGLPETPGKVTPQGWLALGKIATAEALRQGKEPFEYSVQEEPIPVPQPQSSTPPVPTPSQEPPKTTLVSAPGGAQETPAPMPSSQLEPVTIDPKALYALGLRLGESEGEALLKAYQEASKEPGMSGVGEVPQGVNEEDLARRVLNTFTYDYAQAGTDLKLGNEHYEALLAGIREGLSKKGLPAVGSKPKIPQAPGGPSPSGAVRKETIPKPPAEPLQISQAAGIAANILFDRLRKENKGQNNKKYTLNEVNQIVAKNADALYNMIPNPQVSKDQFTQQLGLELSRKLDTEFLLDKSEKSIVSGTPPKSQGTPQPRSAWGPEAPEPTPTTPQPTTPAATSTTPSAPTTHTAPTESKTNVLLNQVNNLAGKVTEGEGVKKEEVKQVAQMIEKAVSPPPPEVQKQVKRVVVAKLKPEFQGNMYLRLIESQYQDPDSPVRKTFEGLYAGEVKSMEELKRLQLENRQLETTVKALYEDPEMVELLKQKIRAEVRELMASGELKLAQARNLEHVLTNEILKTAVSLYASEMLGTMVQQQGNTELLKVVNELANSLKIVNKELGNKELTAQFSTALSQLLARATGEQKFLQFSTKPGWLLGLWTDIVFNLAQFPPQPPLPEQRSPREAYQEALGRAGIMRTEVLDVFGPQGRQNDVQQRILEEIMRMLNQNNRLK